MSVQTVAIISPGEMGYAVGSALKSNGLDISTILAGRSELTRNRAEDAGFRDFPTLGDLLGEADLLLSIVPPATAVDLAREVASAMKATGHRPPYADCNAISPNSARQAGEIISEAGAVYIDGGIIGTPPWKETLPRIYVSGERTELMAQLDGKGISIRPIGKDIGRASGLKICSASLTKGTLALQMAIMIAAQAMGLTEEFKAELLISRENLYRKIESGTRRLPSVSGRYMGEMEEIAATFSAVGVTPKFHQGALDVYRLLAKTPYASETPDTIDSSRTLEEAAQTFANHLPMG
jgi:3-hydroxyisobutyrate dehydrogenase-like beta-hydroxyacid dehydrogenase